MTITVATMTWVRDAEEQDRVQAGLASLARRFRVVAANREADAIPDALHEVAALPNLTVIPAPQPGLVSQVRTAFAEAAGHGADWILYTEPDKVEFFQDHLDAFLERAAMDAAPDTAVVVAGRSPARFAALPLVQREAEALINTWTGRFTEQPGDYSYGPFLLAAACAHWVQTATDDIGWGWRHYMFGLCRRHARQIVHVQGDYPSPPATVEPSREDLLRQRQLAENIRGLLQAAAPR
jgi:hypothetical protein